MNLVVEVINVIIDHLGPVCVVSIVGPCGSGKSFILSEVFSQPQVFRLGHGMDSETMGIWLWIVKEKYKVWLIFSLDVYPAFIKFSKDIYLKRVFSYKDAKGQEFTVVLLDSEGMGAITADTLGDEQIFTLMVLLASAFIYNSRGCPTISGLQRLKYPLKYFKKLS